MVQGCLLLKKESLENKGTMTRLFVHEVMRVYYDRLVDAADRTWLYQLMNDIVKVHFRESFEQLFDHLKKDKQVCFDLVDVVLVVVVVAAVSLLLLSWI